MRAPHSHHRRNLLFEVRGTPLSRARGAELTLALAKVALAADLRVVGQTFHDFQPAGATAMLLLAESHLTAHTWPEEDYVAVDLFTCSPTTRAAVVRGALEAAFSARSITMREIARE